MKALDIPPPHPESKGEGKEEEEVKGQKEWLHESSGCTIKVQNVTVSCSMGCALDLGQLARHIRYAEYNPRRSQQSLAMRLAQPPTTAILYPSGRMGVTGAQSESDAQLAARRLFRLISKQVTDNASSSKSSAATTGGDDGDGGSSRTGVKPRLSPIRTVAMQALVQVPFDVALELLALGKPRQATYDPEVFPGLIYKMQSQSHRQDRGGGSGGASGHQGGVVAFIFCSGRVLFTGARREEDIKAALDKLYPVLLEFKDNDVEHQTSG
eukprot:CAMPEP_0113934296 /NCGR_PEP_ID=MMETSP1339-20121228/1635_1 /TAXON_ID=94617 /ORGANISM="Fibrocapsa japonica" /LENGTH=267 /DNA_ID=CAMNT_0000936029 /DNA_START=52 /DNA_END=855 /DNA_ORIENTATION=- /assembly_acc=CAM_ASM_000762